MDSPAADQCPGGSGSQRPESLGLLLVGAGMLVAGLIRPALNAGRLKPRQFQLIQVVLGRPSTTQQQLVEELRIDPSVLVGLLNDLEAVDIVQRIRDPEDRRRHLVEVSEHGRDVYDKVVDRVATAERAAFAHLDPEQVETLRDLLTSIGDVVERSASETEC